MRLLLLATLLAGGAGPHPIFGQGPSGPNRGVAGASSLEDGASVGTERDDGSIDETRTGEGARSGSPQDERGSTAASIAAALEIGLAGDWERAAPRLRALADSARGEWIPEVHAGLAHAALSRDDPETAWREFEVGRLRHLEAMLGYSVSPQAEPIALGDLQVLLSGARAVLLAYGDSRRVPPLCLVVHEAGLHAFAVEADADLDLLVRDPWSRVPPTAHRLFVQPPLARSDLVFERATVPPRAGDRGTATLGDRLPVSYLPWGSMLKWSAAPRTRSGDGLVVLGGTEPELERVLGGRPRNALEPATRSSWSGERALRADVLYLRGTPPAGHGTEPGATPGEPSGAAEGFPDPRRDATGGILLDDAFLSPSAIAAEGRIADLVLLHPERTPQDPSRMARTAMALIAAGARSVLTFEAGLSEDTVRALEEEIFRAFRVGLPRDEAIRSAAETATRGGSIVAHGAVRIWGPGHLPVYSLVPKRGLGELLVAWILFLGTGFLVLRFLLRRQLGPAPLGTPSDREGT